MGSTLVHSMIRGGGLQKITQKKIIVYLYTSYLETRSLKSENTLHMEVLKFFAPKLLGEVFSVIYLASLGGSFARHNIITFAEFFYGKVDRNGISSTCTYEKI